MRNGSLFDSYEEDVEIDEDAETIRQVIEQADIDDANSEFEDDDNFEVYNEELFEDEDEELDLTSQGF